MEQKQEKIVFNIDCMDPDEAIPIPKSEFTLEREKLESQLKVISQQISEMKRSGSFENGTLGEHSVAE